MKDKSKDWNCGKAPSEGSPKPMPANLRDEAMDLKLNADYPGYNFTSNGSRM